MHKRTRAEMKADTKAWVECAEASFVAAGFLIRRRTRLAANTVCFHSGQCVERYLKARLTEAGLPTPKVGRLTDLLALVLPLEPFWEAFNPTLLALNDEAKFRYPGHIATRADAHEALKACRSIRGEVRLSLGLPKKMNP